MKNWALLGLLYDLHPSPNNYITFKYYHFHFCKKDNPTITASLYLDNLAGEIKNKIAKESSVNKKSLTLAVIEKILENKEARQHFIALLEKRPTALNKEIKQFLSRVSYLIHNLPGEKEQTSGKEEFEPAADFPVRIYVIATHMYLEINNNELHYGTLIRDTSALKEFIISRFKANKIAGRIADMKNFSYKKILSGKNTTGAKGQLMPGARKPDKSWIPFNKPKELRSSIENNLRTLKLEQITLVHFRVMHGDSGFEASMEAMFQMQQEGKILHVGVSNVNAAELQAAMRVGAIATVENMYGHAQRTAVTAPHGETRGGEEVLHICEENEIPLIPFFSLLTAGQKKDNRITTIAQKYGVTEAQVNIAWLLHRSPWMLPIPGTSSLKHFEENVEAANIDLSKEDMAFLD